jgi:hypothetical protein
MDEEQFRRLLRLGLGRAIVHARDHEASPFRDLILDACLHCYAYDPQIEGTRADYMLELIELTPEKELYWNEVLKALPGSGDDWDAVQKASGFSEPSSPTTIGSGCSGGYEKERASESLSSG